MTANLNIEELDPPLAEKLHNEAVRRNTSFADFVLSLLRQALTDLTGNRQVYNDLDSLAGTWTEEEASIFETAIADFEVVDETLWR